MELRVGVTSVLFDAEGADKLVVVMFVVVLVTVALGLVLVTVVQW